MMNNPVSVSEFLSVVKGIVSDIPLFQNVILVGELSNFKAHSSGHFYFSLKDDKARISAVMFRSQAQSVLFKPKDGDKVIIQGRFDVYPQTGQMQVYVSKMNLDGLGDLYIQYEALKKELEEKGYFQSSHKKSLPPYPQRIGVICGAGSAAHADITRTLRSRWPLAEQVDLFSLVQGDGATQDLVTKIEFADEMGLDVIILARGGGSIEDLWAFNTIPVIMAVYNCKTPIVTGIGHESDTTLSDYVADYRAATPTGAAHEVTPDTQEIRITLKKLDRANIMSISRSIVTLSHSFDTIKNKPYYQDYKTLFNYRWMDLDRVNYSLNQHYQQFQRHTQMLKRTVDTMGYNLQHTFQKQNMALDKTVNQFHMNIDFKLSTARRDTIQSNEDLIRGMSGFVTLKKKAFSDILKTLSYLSPLNVMIRGYSVSSHGENVIKSIDDIDISDEMNTRVQDGILISKIVRKELKQ